MAFLKWISVIIQPILLVSRFLLGSTDIFRCIPLREANITTFFPGILWCWYPFSTQGNLNKTKVKELEVSVVHSVHMKYTNWQPLLCFFDTAPGKL